MTGSRSSSIVKSGVKVAGDRVSVDGEEDGGVRGAGSPKFLSDEEGSLAGGGDAVSLEVHVGDGISGGGPRAGDIVSVVDGVLSFEAGEVRDVEGRVVLGIGGIGDELDDGRVGGPDSDCGVHSLDPHVVDRVGGQASDSDRVGGAQRDVGNE